MFGTLTCIAGALSTLVAGADVSVIDLSGVDFTPIVNAINGAMPSLSIEFMGVSYNLYSCVGFLGSGIETIKGFIRVFLWVGFIVSLFRSLPSIIGGVSSVQDHSNNVVVDRHTGEVAHNSILCVRWCNLFEKYERATGGALSAYICELTLQGYNCP